MLSAITEKRFGMAPGRTIQDNSRILRLKLLMMYNNKIEEDLDCGIRVAFKIFGGKWKLCILDAISKGITRPTDIQKEMKEASRRVIEMQLAELLFYGTVEKNTTDAYPKKSEYKLTVLGQSILPILNQIDKWGTANSAYVKSKQLELETL